MLFGLSQRDLNLMREIFKRYPIIDQVTVFGSRAMGNCKPYSDIDLALIGNFGDEMARKIGGELDELPMPYEFDVLAMNAIKHPPLVEHILTKGKVFYKKEDV